MLSLNVSHEAVIDWALCWQAVFESFPPKSFSTSQILSLISRKDSYKLCSRAYVGLEPVPWRIVVSFCAKIDCNKNRYERIQFTTVRNEICNQPKYAVLCRIVHELLLFSLEKEDDSDGKAFLMNHDSARKFMNFERNVSCWTTSVSQSCYCLLPRSVRLEFMLKW